MKKLILVFVFISFSIGIFAHEISLLYALRDENLYNDSEDKGFKLNYALFSWGDNDFSNYAFSFVISELSPTFSTISINKAWLKIPVIRELDLRIGKQYHDFGNVGKSGSC